MKFSFALAAAFATVTLSGNVVAGPAEDIIAKEKCSKCHTATTTKKGPSWASVAEKYKGKADAEAKIVEPAQDRRQGRPQQGRGQRCRPEGRCPGRAVVEVRPAGSATRPADVMFAGRGVCSQPCLRPWLFDLEQEMAAPARLWSGPLQDILEAPHG